MTLQKVLNDWWIEYNYNQQLNYIQFVTGSKIYFYDLAYQPSDPHYTRLGGLEITWAFIDEANEIDELCRNIIISRISDKLDQHNLIPKILYTCNPSKNWVYNLFYKPYKEWTLSEDKAFIPALVTDNPHISQEYIKSLENTDKITRERLLYGNFEYDDTPWKLYDYDDILALFANEGKRGDKYITCDVARMGADKAVIYVWDGFVEIAKEVYPTCTIDQLANHIRRLASLYNITMSHVVVDEDGIGWWLRDILKCKGFLNNSSAIQKKRTDPTHKVLYANLKTQCYFELGKYIRDGSISLQSDQYKNTVIEELDSVRQIDIDKEWLVRIASKDDIKKSLGRSPDFSDSIMMRIYFEIVKEPQQFAYFL